MPDRLQLPDVASADRDRHGIGPCAVDHRADLQPRVEPDRRCKGAAPHGRRGLHRVPDSRRRVEVGDTQSQEHRAGPDGAVWFTDSFERRIWRSTTSGALTSFSANLGAPNAITAGPDGALWFTAGQLGRITTTGAVSSMAVPSGPNGVLLGAITSDADGNLWLGGYDLTRSGGVIVRSTTAGAMTSTTLPTYTEIDGITRGPDGASWFTQMDNQTGVSKIGRIAL